MQSLNGTAEVFAEKAHLRRVAVAQALLPVLRFLLLRHQRTAKSGCATEFFPQSVKLCPTMLAVPNHSEPGSLTRACGPGDGNCTLLTVEVDIPSCSSCMGAFRL